MIDKFVVINEEPKGLEISLLRKKDNIYEIRFGNSKVYQYKDSSVTVYGKWHNYDPDSCIVTKNGKLLDNVSRIRRYYSTDSTDEVSECWRLWLDDDEYEIVDYYNDKKLRVMPNILEYLTNVVSVNAQIIHDVYSKIELLYEDINEFYESGDLSESANCFLKGKNKKTSTANTDKLILPFDCNDSQLKATEEVFHNSISVIVGPPGTGKTQTILNIIANIVYKGKTVLVVSNSNNAISNIKERLDTYGLGFIVANLGNFAKRNEFIENRERIPSDIYKWSEQGISRKEAYENLDKLKAYYAYKQAIQGHKNLVSMLEKKEHDLSSLLDERSVPSSTNNTSVDRITEAIEECEKRKKHLTKEIESLEKRIKDLESIEQDIIDTSLALLKKKLSKRYNGNELKKLSANKNNEFSFNKLTKRYSVVLSTAASVMNSFTEYPDFDYVIIDEASQMSIDTGFLSLVAAENAVLVGDDKQLGHIVTDDQKKELNKLLYKRYLPDGYNVVKSSFLDSVCNQVEGICKTMLLEHYRCDPQIIGFSNKEFYDGKLVVMTEDSNDSTMPLRIRKAAIGNHARGHINKRQVDIIKNEVLPDIKTKHPDWTIGVITPYKDQKEAIREANALTQELATDDIEVSTIHAFQGKEKDVIILSTVDNRLEDFSFINDSRMLNVAVTRAKRQFIMIVNDAPIYKTEGILKSLVHYILERSPEEHSNIRSIYDFLYDKGKMVEYLSSFKDADCKCKYASEKLTDIAIDTVLSNLRLKDRVCVERQVKLRSIVYKDIDLTKDENTFIKNGASLDFLLRDKNSNSPILAIEVDGYAFHKPGSYQKEVRDSKKNSILKKTGIELLRLTTLGSEEEQQISDALKKVVINRGAIRN